MLGTCHILATFGGFFFPSYRQCHNNFIADFIETEMMSGYFPPTNTDITEDKPNSLYEIVVPQTLSLEWQNDADTVSVSIRKIPSDTAHLSVTAAILHESQKAALEVGWFLFR